MLSVTNWWEQGRSFLCIGCLMAFNHQLQVWQETLVDLIEVLSIWLAIPFPLANKWFCFLLFCFILLYFFVSFCFNSPCYWFSGTSLALAAPPGPEFLLPKRSHFCPFLNKLNPAPRLFTFEDLPGIFLTKCNFKVQWPNQSFPRTTTFLSLLLS